MKIVIAGLGGVGGVVGGKLAAGLAGSAEHQVIFWCRGETLAAVKDKGLEVLGHDGTITVRPSLATHSAGEIGTADLIVFATKNYHLEEAARELAGAANEKTVLLPLLNGVSALGVLEKLLPKSDALGGCIYISAHVERPGVVKQVGAVQRVLLGKRGMGAEENAARYGHIERALKESGLSITLTDKIDAEMWSKMLFLSPFAGVTTLFKRSISEVIAGEESFETVTLMIKEIEALARAKGIELPADIAELTIEKARAFMPFTKTSMQVDQENGRQTELESLIGYVCAEAKALGVPAPTYEKVYGGIKTAGASN